MPIESRTSFVGLAFDQMTLHEAVEWVFAHARARQFSYVVTPNVDHRVRLEKMGDTSIGQELWDACQRAQLCLCDSRVLSRLAALFGKRLTVVPGSDLTAAILARTPAVMPIALIGGDTETCEALLARYGVSNIVQHIPPMGMLASPAAMTAAVEAMRNSGAELIFIAVGSPQGEILAHRAKEAGLTHGVALCIGASIDFLTGRQTRAPLLMRRAGLEWLFRLTSQPRRMWRRYLVDGPRIFRIAFREQRER